MADLNLTPSLVVAQQRGKRASGVAAAAVTAGLAVCRDAATGRWLAASAVAATSRGRTPGGLALNAAANGQPVAVHRRGLIDLGEDLLTVGVVYYLSPTSGRLCLLGDLEPGDAIVAIGLAYSARLLSVSIQVLDLGDGAIDDPPVNTVLPSILGVAQVGELLSVDLGDWDNSPSTYAVQWRLNGVAITGETADEYLVDDVDEGGLITVTVTATNIAGSTSATSLATAPVEPAPVEGGGEGTLDFSDPDNSGLIGLL